MATLEETAQAWSDENPIGSPVAFNHGIQFISASIASEARVENGVIVADVSHKGLTLPIDKLHCPQS